MKITVTTYLAGMVNHGTMDEMAKITDIIMLNKNTYGAKKGEANQKQQLSDYSSD